MFGLVTLTFLTLFGLIAKPQLVRAGTELMRPQHAQRFERVQREVCEAISYSLIGNVVISVIAASVVGVAAVIVGAPSPMVLALIVGLFDLIPQVGSTIAAIIVVSITLVAEGAGPAVILLIVILVYQQLENYLIQPAVMRQAVELSGFATIASVLLGSALLGVVGAVLAVPVAASVKIVVRELTDGRRRGWRRCAKRRLVAERVRRLGQGVELASQRLARGAHGGERARELERGCDRRADAGEHEQREHGGRGGDERGGGDEGRPR